MSFDFNFNFNFTVQIILVLNFCYSVMIISIVISITEISITEISILIVNMTGNFTGHDLILEIHQHTQKHVNIKHRDCS